MLIIAGYARTGTSILFKCLEKSGFYGGTKDQLFGHHYKTQHREFNGITKEILGWMKTQMMPVPVRKWQVPEQVHDVLRELGSEMEKQGINMIKDPQAAPVMQLWIDTVSQFQNPKFIRIERNALEVAKSCARLWITQGWRKRVDVRQVVRRYEFDNHLWELTSKNHPTVKIQYNELFDNNGTRDKISEFIGRPFDMSLIDPEKTYKASKQVY